MVGTPDEIVTQLRQMEKDGLKELNLLPAADHQKEVWEDFAQEVFPAFRLNQSPASSARGSWGRKF